VVDRQPEQGQGPDRRRDQAGATARSTSGGRAVVERRRLITLLDASGLKVHGVSYTKAQVARQGWSVVF
jgi:hypothetical protein